MSGRPGWAGLSPAAKAFWIASAATSDPRRDVVVVVVPTDRDVEQIVADSRFFLGGLEGSSAAELEHTVLPYPSQEVDPYRGLTPHLRISSARARALHALAAGHARIVVASATALLPRVTPPAALTGTGAGSQARRRHRHAARGRSCSSTRGSRAQDPVDEHGEFCIRGGVIDIFPAGDDLPARIELIGDTIEAIRRYDPDTQRSTETIDSLRIVPLRDVSFGTPVEGGGARPQLSSIFDYAGFARRPVFVASEYDELRDRAETWLLQVSESYEQRGARRHAAGARRDPALVGRTSNGTSRAPRAWRNWEYEDHAPSHDDRVSTAASRRRSPPSGGPSRAQQFLRTSRVSRALSYSGRLTEWINEVKAARERGDTVLFVAATPGRAERLVELLAGLRAARRAHRPRRGLVRGAACSSTTGVLSRGFRLPAAQLQIFAETDLFEEERRARNARADRARAAFLSDLRDLKVGDLVVHVDNGIGEFVGLQRDDRSARTRRRSSSSCATRATTSCLSRCRASI